MARSRSSLGLFGIFGRSADLRQMDQALRSVDVHPRMVPEAVKLTAVALLKDHAIGPEPAPQAYRAAAEIVAYCMIGADGFSGANGDDLTQTVERRIEAALDKPEGLDAQLVLLTLHAKIIQPSVVHQFQLDSASE
ncbi:MAG: hypothetical protein ABWY14_11955 [Tardiphaga sp.]|jgi:hypothetical protein